MQPSISARRKIKTSVFAWGAGSQRIQRWYFYIGHTLFSGMGSWADGSQLLEESSDFWDAAPVTGMWAAMADISPVWLSAVIPGRSEVWFMLLSGMVPTPVKCWSRHFRNWFIVLIKEEGGGGGGGNMIWNKSGKNCLAKRSLSVHPTQIMKLSTCSLFCQILIRYILSAQNQQCMSWTSVGRWEMLRSCTSSLKWLYFDENYCMGPVFILTWRGLLLQ